MTAARPLLAAAVLLLAACGSSTPVPLPSQAAPSPAAVPSSSVQVTPDASTPSGAPGDGVPPPATLPMPGFAAYEQVRMAGSEMAATVFTAMSCDALAGWLQAGDWRLDGDAFAPAPSAPPVEGAIAPPPTRWLVLSRPGDGAVAELVTNEAGSGCWASVSRLSRQSLSAEGAFVTATSGLAYQLACSSYTQSVTVGAFFMGDDGTRAVVTADVPLEVGQQALSGGSVRIGRMDLSLATLTEAFTRSIETSLLDELMPGTEPYDLENGGSGTANVTSIDPLVAEISFEGLTSASGATQGLTVGIRCDLSGHQLTQAALPPEVTPPPTVAPAGSMSVSIGTGEGSISEVLAGSQITCSYGIIGRDTWLLSHDDSEGVSVFLFIPPEGSATISFYDFRQPLPVTVEIDPARTGGNLTATVEDRGTDVGFTALGLTGDGRELNLTATCAAVERI